MEVLLHEDEIPADLLQYFEDVPLNEAAALTSVFKIGPEPSHWDFCLACGTFFDSKGVSRKAIKKRGNKRVCPCGASDAWVDHYALFPPELPKRCILAATSDKGVCPKCGAPWVPVVEREVKEGAIRGTNMAPEDNRSGYPRARIVTAILSYRPTCSCDAGESVPAIVLDPFSGAGTTGLAALRLGRNYIGIDLSPQYTKLAEARLSADAPMMV